ncbi:MAG: 16S rRNA (cytosine(1402)-N(4))-methyltransferase RsmH [Candidatus Pacebacteria bacterium]|jgi:16S rRNA (cytosine1402-N4)-methyltransferase|nr:16S rRNA (cytosine(1402)-N(4))-methyltransferase RsmH [Candidatus Paceibacterota bacterium]|tara:strand:+ start:59412 stop:60320 length:909 start_codon:yes stop_codon:yes gene_type:complete
MHIPVLLQEVIESLNLKKGDTAIDTTIGGGGHAREICKLIGSTGTLIGIDLDRRALDGAKAKLKDGKCNIILEQKNFRDLDKVLKKAGIEKVDAVLFDLGFSSDQLEESKQPACAGRGFSFQKNEPLLMTFKESPDEKDLTAKEILGSWEEESIADILYGYGEEKFSRQIAKKIVELRDDMPIETTRDLVEVIDKAVPNWYKHKKIHFATKTFQALRITVNDEIGALKEALGKALYVLKAEGRIAVISFHSIEDRIVKRFFNNKKQEGEGEVITKKPIIPSEDEIKRNPRSRSAKLRVFQKK